MNRSVRILLFATFLMNFGTFAVYTFLAIYLSNTLQFSAVQVGSVLTVLMITARVLPFFGGSFADKIGYAHCMMYGMMIRALGFISFAYSLSFEWAIASAALTGLGTALYEPAVSAFFSRQDEKVKKRIFTYFNQALNAGAIVGPLAGGVLITFEASLPFLLGSALYTVIGVLIFTYRADLTVKVTAEDSMKTNMINTLKDKPFLYFNLTMVLFWIMYSQLTVMFPLMMYKMTQSQADVSFLITTNSICGLLVMFLLRRLFEVHNPMTLIIRGMMIMTIGLFSSWIFLDKWWLLLCVIVFTLGETLVLPASDIKVSLYSEGKASGTYFGLSKISFGIGASIGSFFGPILFNLNQWEGLPWLLISFTGTIGAALMMYLKKKEHNSAYYSSVKHS
ncbi:MFS transporter [Bacillus manliponensis]|uniref:MFS transporter n=1 Tax=Bacillus manliponensis TaxID=574376 RepID=UPI003513ACC8